MKKISLIACAIAAAFLCACNPGTTVSVEDFGAKPDDGVNDADALRAAAKYCREHPNTTLVFPAGVYDFSDPDAARIEREAIDGTYGYGLQVQRYLFIPTKPYVTGLDFTGARNLTIEAYGAKLMVEGWMELLAFIRCKNVTVKGLQVDYKRHNNIEAVITAIKGDIIEAEFDPEYYKYSDKLVQGRTEFYNPRIGQFYDCDGGMIGSPEPGKVLFKFTRSISEVGDILVIRHGGHYRPCYMLRESENVTLKDIIIYSFPGMGVVGHETENILLDHIQVVPYPGRYTSTTTDATHFTSCRGNITIQNCMFRGCLDDCTNIHNYYWYPYAQEDQNKVEIRVEKADLHAQSLDYPHKGDTLSLIHRRSIAPLDKFVVRDVDTSWVDWKVIVTLDKPITQAQCDSGFLYNTNFIYANIVNNTVVSKSGRAFYVKVPRAYVGYNKIIKTSMTALKIGGELWWHEAGPIKDILVEHNYIANCNYIHTIYTHPDWDGSVIYVTSDTEEVGPYINSGLVVRDNVFTDNYGSEFVMCDCENCHIYRNVSDSLRVVQNHCQNIIIE